MKPMHFELTQVVSSKRYNKVDCVLGNRYVRKLQKIWPLTSILTTVGANRGLIRGS